MNFSQSDLLLIINYIYFSLLAIIIELSSASLISTKVLKGGAYMKWNEKGLTLVEVLASLAIITVVLLSVAQLVIQSNKTNSFNNEKLVIIDLADAILERLKAEPYIVKQTIEAASNPKEEIEIPLDSIHLEHLSTIHNGGKDYYIINMNGNTYQVNAYAKKTSKQEISDFGLRTVVVKVKRVEVDSSGKTISDLKGKSEVEGYVEL